MPRIGPLPAHPRQLVSVRLDPVSARRPQAALRLPDQQRTNRPVVGTFLQAGPGQQADEEQPVWRCACHLRVDIRWPSYPGPFEIRFTIRGDFSTQERLTRGRVRRFGDVNAVTLLWPFAREYAFDLMRRLGV